MNHLMQDPKRGPMPFKETSTGHPNGVQRASFGKPQSPSNIFNQSGRVAAAFSFGCLEPPTSEHMSTTIHPDLLPVAAGCMVVVAGNLDRIRNLVAGIVHHPTVRHFHLHHSLRRALVCKDKRRFDFDPAGFMYLYLDHLYRSLREVSKKS